jgi:hypothetical protein
MDRSWGMVFRRVLGKAERSLVNELLDVRNRWAYQEPFSSDDTDRALDSMARGGDTARRRGQWPLPAGRVRR